MVSVSGCHVLHIYYMQWNIGPRVWMMVMMLILAIYLPHFSKAFGCVPHQCLLSKLKAYDISGNVLIWIMDFLSNRRQRVNVNGSCSDWSSVISGVPQGSVLGPLLFIVYINYLPEAVQSNIAIFADDSKLYRSIVTPDDSRILQSDLDLLVKS